MVTIFAKKARNIQEKIIGLIGRKEPVALMIKTRFGIHTFGLRFPIDVLILDKSDTVVKMSKHLKPNRIFLWNPIFNKIVELPKGWIEKNNIKIGDKIKLMV